MTIAAHVHQWREFLLTERTEWRIHPGCSKRGTPERRYAEFLLENMEAVFGAYVGGREWYFVVEWGVLVVSAAVLGAAEITAIDDAANACVAAQWGIGTVLALSAAQVVLCVWLRPFTVRAEFCVAVLLGMLSVVCQALALAWDVDASAQLDSVAAIVEIVVLVFWDVDASTQVDSVTATLEIVFIVLLMGKHVTSLSLCSLPTVAKEIDIESDPVPLVTQRRHRQRREKESDSDYSPTFALAPRIEKEISEQLGALIALICERHDTVNS